MVPYASKDGRTVAVFQFLTGNAAISGSVYTSSGEMVENAQITLSNLTTGTSDYYMSGLEGGYAFSSNSMYSDYDITVDKKDDFLNGVSTLDLILIQRHILGLEPFDNVYSVIAGDLNTDERITALDLVVLRSLIIGLVDELPGGESWKFVRADQEFTDILRPWPINEAINIASIDHEMIDQNFKGVKLGDVNGNAIVNSAMRAKSRSNKPTHLTPRDSMSSRANMTWS